MDMAAITLEPDVVEAQLDAYERHNDRASTAIKSALAALQDGLMVVDLRTVFHEAMYDGAQQRMDTSVRMAHAQRFADREAVMPRCIRLTPSVAVAPARLAGHRLRLTVRGSGHLVFRCGMWRLRVPQSVRTSNSRRVLDRWAERVPVTPPYIEQQPGDLILWEADWARVPRREFDPALLEHLNGWLYVVREVWDLTEVERAVLT